MNPVNFWEWGADLVRGDCLIESEEFNLSSLTQEMRFW